MYWFIALERCDLKVGQYPSMFISLYFSLKPFSLLNQLAIDLVEEHCLQQCVTEPTREKNILDLVLTTCTNENLVHKTDVMDGMSDHQMIV
jgi:hypothetical protein